MRHQTINIAILGADTLVENILVGLLEDAGYATRPSKLIPREY
jgi:hypothetical protein